MSKRIFPPFPRNMWDQSTAAVRYDKLVQDLIARVQEGGPLLVDDINSMMQVWRQDVLEDTMDRIASYYDEDGLGERDSFGMMGLDHRTQIWMDKLLDDILPDRDKLYEQHEIDHVERQGFERGLMEQAMVALERGKRSRDALLEDVRQTGYDEGFEEGKATALSDALESGEYIKWQQELPYKRGRTTDE